MSPLEVIRHFSKQLSEFERTEILEYPDVYFIGPGAKKILGSPHLEFNFGYDDEQGDYKFVEGDQIGYRYEVIKFLGKGSFGICLKCIDHKTHAEIALKVVKNK
jgi:dual specificity tyrosine-phosphorylation-regulated kinase 2/3/4